MHIISRRTLREFWESAKHEDAEGPLKAWFREVDRANWKTSADIKLQFGNASIVDAERVVFNIAGNKYRLIVRINYESETVFIRFVGTHAEYDKVDAKEI